MFPYAKRSGAAPLAVAAVFSLSIMNTVTAANTAPPRAGSWLHTVGKCTNFHNAPTWASDCRHLDGGTWQGANTHPSCIDMAHPRPWSIEALIEPLVSAREGNKPTRFTGWMAPGETTSCTGAWSGGMRFTLGLESSNLGMVEVGGSSDTNYMARRWREVSCPDGYRNEGGICTLPSGHVTAHKNNDECPAAPNGSNPVHSSTGKKLQRETDYRGLGPFPLEFTRFYSSGHRNYFNGTHIRPHHLGPNWRHTYSRAIVLVESSGVRWATVVRPNGNEYFFRQNAQGQWIGDADIGETLESFEGDGGRIDSWRYLNRNDETEEYDASGRLVRITSREGFEKTLAYGLTPDEGGDGLPTTLDRVTGPFAGQSLGFTYGDDGSLTQMTVQPSGDVYRFRYRDGLLTQVVYPHDQDNLAHPQSYAENPSRRYHYDETGHVTSNTPRAALTGIVDEAGTRYASWWYSGDRVVRSQLAPDDLDNVNRVDIQYHSDGSRTVTDALGTSRVYRFRVQHGVARIASISGGKCQSCGSDVQSVTYDSNGYRRLVTDFNGNVTQYTHDARGRETQRIEGYGTPSARTVRTQWHPELRVPVQIDRFAGEGTAGAHLQQTLQTYSGGRLATRTEIDPETGSSRTWSYSYNDKGLLSAMDGPRTDIADITTFTYDASGNLASVTNALGHVTHITSYNGHGQPLTIVDPNGVATSLTYDARQRLTSRTIAGETTAFAYTPTGQLARITFADGSFVSYSYDAANRLIEVADSRGHRIAHTLDALGNRVAEERFDDQGQLRAVQTRVFDELNRLWKEIGAAGTEEVTTTYSYDGNGQLTGLLAPLGRNTEQLYDALNRPTRIVDAFGGVTEFTYDALDRIIAVQDPRGVVTTYTYDGLGNLVREDSPDAGSTTMTHDPAGNVRTRTDARGDTLSYEYDALDRVTRADIGDTTWVYTYDAGANGFGRLAKITDGSQTLSWEHDPQGRVLTREQNMDGIVLTLRYSYSDGKRTGIETPSGQRIGYTHAHGRPDRVTLNGTTVLVDQIAYEPFGPVSGWRWGDGSRTTRSHDLDLRPVLIDSAGRRSYSYDAASRIDGIVDLQDLARSRGYVYDALDRLTESSGTDTLRRWTYDANGNRLQETGDAPADYTPAADSNRLLTVRGVLQRDHIHDAAGNLLEDGRRSFRYNAAGRMVSATVDGRTTTYLYNGLGERVRKLVESDAAPAPSHPGRGRGPGDRLNWPPPGWANRPNLPGFSGPAAIATETRYFMYDEDGRLIGEYGPEGELIHETVWLEDIPIAALYPDGNGGVQVYYVHTDHLNTPRRLTRPGDGTIVWRWDSDPFGTTAADEDPDGDGERITYPLRFPGQYHDQETSLHYNYFRDYEPHTGRYIQSDPIGLVGGVNTYGYAENSPLQLIDPFGLNAFAAATAGSGGRTSGDGSAAIGVGATIGTTTIGVNSFNQGVLWGQTTQLSIGLGLELCIGLKKENICSTGDVYFPDNYTIGVGRHMGFKITSNFLFCINFGPSWGFPAGFGWDL